MLRISIDQPAGIAIEDCEKVTRQLQYLFEVENIDYAGSKSASPGLDRPLKKLADFERFAGSEVCHHIEEAAGRAQVVPWHPACAGRRNDWFGIRREGRRRCDARFHARRPR